MRPRASHIILVAATILVIATLSVHATDPILYSAENISTDAHADPSTIKKRSPGDAAAVIPLMDELLGGSGTLALTIKVKDYESAERDLARYTDLSGQFSNLIVKLDLSETDVGEFQKKTRENLDSFTTLLNDSRRLDDLKRLEIEVEGDDGQRMAIAYEGEALRQKMQGTFSAYAEREPVVTRIAENYDLNTTPYQESIGDLAEVVEAADDWRDKAGGKTSPLSITLTPTEGSYGDVIRINGTYLPSETPVGIYVDSRLAKTVAFDDNGRYACSYRIGEILAGSHLVYATTGSIFSGVRTFTVIPQNTTLTLTLAEVNRTAVACTGTLMTGNRSVTGAPVLLRVDGTTLVATRTDGNGTYEKEITLPAGEHTIRAEFHGAGFPLNPSVSDTGTLHVPDNLPSPLPILAGVAALIGTGWYLRRRQERPEKAPSETPPELPEEEGIKFPAIDIESLPPRDAATVLFHLLRTRLGLPGTKTPRDCAKVAYPRFFERYERIRYAGETPTEEELRWMEMIARGEDEHEA